MAIDLSFRRERANWPRNEVFIGAIYHTPEEMKTYVRNQVNNENWDTIHDFIAKKKKWEEEISKAKEKYNKIRTETPNPATHEEIEKEQKDNFFWTCASLISRKKSEIKFVFNFTYKNRPIEEIENVLFNYRNVWYEVSDWEEIVGGDGEEDNLLSIVGEKSIYYNHYYDLALTSANGIIYHSPHGKVEICSCPNYGVNDTYFDFVGDYELDFNLTKVDEGWFKTSQGYESFEETYLPLFIGEMPQIVVKTKEQFLKTKGKLSEYYLLGKELTKETNLAKKFSHKRILINWVESGEWNGFSFVLTKKTLNDKLRELGFLDEEGNLREGHEHFLRNHIEAEMAWRQKEGWKVDFWDIFNHTLANEVVNSAGNFVVVEANRKIVKIINETISTKVEKNEALSKMINIGSAAVIGTIMGGVVGGIGAAAGVKTKDELSAIGAGLTKSSSYLLRKNLTSYSQKTFYQFQNEYFYSGKYPLTLKIEFNQTLLNQFIQKREIKGKQTYDYFSTKSFGDYLQEEGYFSADIITWNYTSEKPEWFREKIRSGVYIGKKFYNLELSETKLIKSNRFLRIISERELKEINSEKILELREDIKKTREFFESKRGEYQKEKRELERSWNMDDWSSLVNFFDDKLSDYEQMFKYVEKKGGELNEKLKKKLINLISELEKFNKNSDPVHFAYLWPFKENNQSKIALKILLAASSLSLENDNLFLKWNKIESEKLLNIKPEKKIKKFI